MRDLGQLLDLHVVHRAADRLMTNRTVLTTVQDIRENSGKRTMHNF